MDTNDVAKAALIKGIKLGAETAAMYIDDVFVIKKVRKTVKQLIKYTKKKKLLVDISDDKVRIHEDQTVEKDPNKERLVECAHCGVFTSSFFKYCPHCGSLMLRRQANENR